MIFRPQPRVKILTDLTPLRTRGGRGETGILEAVVSHMITNKHPVSKLVMFEDGMSGLWIYVVSEG